MRRNIIEGGGNELMARSGKISGQCAANGGRGGIRNPTVGVAPTAVFKDRCLNHRPPSHRVCLARVAAREKSRVARGRPARNESFSRVRQRGEGVARMRQVADSRYRPEEQARNKPGICRNIGRACRNGARPCLARPHFGHSPPKSARARRSGSSRVARSGAAAIPVWGGPERKRARVSWSAYASHGACALRAADGPGERRRGSGAHARGVRIADRPRRSQPRRLGQRARRRRGRGGAEGRRAPARGASLHDRRADLRAAPRSRLFQRGPRLVVRRALPRPQDRQRRDLRPLRDVRRAHHDAAAELCAGQRTSRTIIPSSCASTIAGRSTATASSTCRGRPPRRSPSRKRRRGAGAGRLHRARLDRGQRRPHPDGDPAHRRPARRDADRRRDLDHGRLRRGASRRSIASLSRPPTARSRRRSPSPAHRRRPRCPFRRSGPPR